MHRSIGARLRDTTRQRAMRMSEGHPRSIDQGVGVGVAVGHVPTQSVGDGISVGVGVVSNPKSLPPHPASNARMRARSAARTVTAEA